MANAVTLVVPGALAGAVIVIENVPAGILTLAGTLTIVELLLDKETAKPAGGAGPLRVTVKKVESPTLMLAGFAPIPLKATGTTDNVALFLTPLRVAEMVADCEAVTVLVVIAKVAVVSPGATVTFAGTVATAVLELINCTTAPPAGAGPVNVTVPATVAPPPT